MFKMNPKKHTDLFEIEAVPNKGTGLVARVDIPKGTRILSEKPLVTVQSIRPLLLLGGSITGSSESPSPAEQRTLPTFVDNYPARHPYGGTMKINDLSQGSDTSVGGIFVLVRLINHSCVPNAHQSWNAELRRETIHATRDIKAYEEITISYDVDRLFESRQKHLKSDFGFECACELCSLPELELELSDARRRLIQRLDHTVGNPFLVMHAPRKCISYCRKLLSLLEQEYKTTTDARVARVYYDAFQISIAFGDVARAKIFAERAYKSRVSCEGEDSPETREMRDLVIHPEGHPNLGISMEWHTDYASVPTNLDPHEFEEWLWLRANNDTFK